MSGDITWCGRRLRRALLLVAGVVVLVAVSAAAAAGRTAASAVSLSLGDRIECQAAIEQVYWRHRSATARAGSATPPFSRAVPATLIRRKAEDAVRKSAALERYWGVTVTAAMLQAELRRMAAASKSPTVLRELLNALGNDPQRAAECLARPALADRLIRSNYASDDRFHEAVEAQARAELAAATPAAMQAMSGRYTQWEWRRGDRADAARGTLWLDDKTFDQRVKTLGATLGGRSGELAVGRLTGLREDDAHFYAAAVLEQDGEHVRVATVGWPKTPFDSWWADVRSGLPTELSTPAAQFELPPLAPDPSCRDDSWKPTAQLLDARYHHTAVWTGSEMIVFGGMSIVGTIYDDGSRYDPATDTWTLVSRVGAPSYRQAHVAVWTGKEMVIWGGRSDATGGRYDPVTDTWKPTGTIGAPSPRWDATVVWTGKEMLVWGGQGGGTLNTGGRYDPKADRWTAMATAPLAGRAYQAVVWTGKEMVVWGGYDGFIGRMYGDGARYNPATNTWKPVRDAGAPNARFYHTGVWTGKEMIVWGGINYPDYDLSGGRYNPATDTWKRTSLANAPSLRWMHAAVWTGKEMIVQGGTPVNATGGRYDPVADKWTPTSPVNAAVNGQGITAVWTGTEMIVWGGLDDDGVFHYDGARYDPRTDAWVRTGTMNVPRARGLHSAVWTGSEMMVWGGFAGDFTNSGGLYDPATDSWRPTTTVGAPAGRENAEAAWTGSEAIFWGGDPDGHGLGSGGRYDPASDSWELMSMVNAPTNRYGHTAVWTGKEYIVFGGVWGDNVAKRYDPESDVWRNATTTNAPGARDHHGAVWTGKEMVIWGGFINDGATPTGGRYDPALDRWRPTNVPQSPPTRMWPISAWTGTEAIFWGGHIYNGDYVNDGGRYNPVSDAW
jgi:N-acetylneuraminic acid mutarotase